MTLLFILLATAAPNAIDVQEAEEGRIVEPLIDWNAAVDGGGFVEFAPTIETRNATCAPARARLFECSYETRIKDAFASDFGPWEARVELLTWHEKCDCWRTVSPKP
jgi:hypothetical protein